jgi:hypothetical protein
MVELRGDVRHRPHFTTTAVRVIQKGCDLTRMPGLHRPLRNGPFLGLRPRRLSKVVYTLSGRERTSAVENERTASLPARRGLQNAVLLTDGPAARVRSESGCEGHLSAK